MPITTWKSEGGTETDAAATWSLTGNHPLFTRSFAISFAELSLKKHVVTVDGTAITGSFDHWDYNTRDAGSPEGISVSDKGAALYCTLPAPRQIRKISLSHPDAAASGHKVKLYRLDGDAMADSPTIQVNNNAVISDAFVAARFAITLEDGSGARKNLSVSQLTDCTVRSVPTAPRLQLAPPEGVEGAIFPLWQQPGQPEGSDRNFSLSDALADAANTLFDAIGPGESPQLRIILSADAPAWVAIFEFSIETESQLLDLPWSDKRRFVFDGSGDRSHEVPLSIAPGSTIAAAACESVESFSVPSTPIDNSPETLPQPTSGGIRIGLHQAVDQPFSISDAIELTALWCGLIALTPDSHLSASIVEAGTERTVALSEQQLPRIGWQGGVRLGFDPIVLPGGNYSIRITCDKGVLLWHTSPGAPAPVSSAGYSYDGDQALHAVERTVQTAELTSPDAGPSIGGQPFRIDISGTPVADGAIGANGRRTHDLLSALSATLAAGTQPLLCISSRQKGEVTLYPLSLRLA